MLFSSEGGNGHSCRFAPQALCSGTRLDGSTIGWNGLASLKTSLERKSLTRHWAEVTQQPHHPNDSAQIKFMGCSDANNEGGGLNTNPSNNYVYHIWIAESIELLRKYRQRQNVIGSPPLVFYFVLFLTLGKKGKDLWSGNFTRIV